MAYVTKQDLIDRFGALELTQLTDRTNIPPATIDDTVVGRAIGDAEVLAEGYVGKLYQLPLSSVPAALTKVCADLARYFLHGKAADEAVVRAHKEAMDWLKDVSRGLIVLDADGVTPAPAGGGSVKANPGNRVFTRDTLRSA